MTWGEINEGDKSLIAGEQSADAHGLAAHVSVGKQGWLGRSGRAGGEDDECAIVLRDFGKTLGGIWDVWAKSALEKC
jgi:hypothetical protein